MPATQLPNQESPSPRFPVRQVIGAQATRFGGFARTSTAHLISAARLLCDGTNLVFVDKEIRLAFTRKPDHPVVEVLDPTGNHLSVAQLHGDAHLLLAEETQVQSFLPGFSRRRRFLAPAR